MRLALTLGLIVLVCGVASAFQTTDSVILLVTPAFNLSVNISSTTNSFGDVDLKTSATICVGDIVNDGNVDSYWEKCAVASAENGQASNSWALAVTPADYNATVPAGDRLFRLLALTTGTAMSDGMFTSATSNRLLAGRHEAGTACLAVKSTFDDLVESGNDTTSPLHAGNSVSVKRLWVSIMMPCNVNGPGPYTMTLSVRATTTP